MSVITANDLKRGGVSGIKKKQQRVMSMKF